MVERLPGFVPLKRNRGVFSLFVVVIVAFVLVEREPAVRAAINAKLDRVRWFLSRVLHHRTERHNGTSADIQRQDVDGRIGRDGFAASEGFAGPEIHPTCAGRKINRPARCVRRRDRAHQKRRAKHIFVGNGEHIFVLRKIHHQRAHRACSWSLRNFPRNGIIVGQHPVTQLVEGDQIGLRFRQPVPDFGRGPGPVDAQDRAERAPLKPARQQFIVIGRLCIDPADGRSRRCPSSNKANQ